MENAIKRTEMPEVTAYLWWKVCLPTHKECNFTH